MSAPRPDLDKFSTAELEAAYKSAMAGNVKPPMVCTSEGFWILNESDGTYTKHNYDPELDAYLAGKE